MISSNMKVNLKERNTNWQRTSKIEIFRYFRYDKQITKHKTAQNVVRERCFNDFEMKESKGEVMVGVNVHIYNNIIFLYSLRIQQNSF